MDAIERVKKNADELAELAAKVCVQRLLSSPHTAALAMSVKPNFKFYRRKAGLRNGDLTK